MVCIDGKWPLTAATADFSDFGTRVELAAKGIFSIDAPAHKARRALEAHHEAKITASYDAIGLDRAQEYRRIAARLEKGKTDGIWARSTKEYAEERTKLDEQVAEFQKRNNRKMLDPYQVKVAARGVQPRMFTRELLSRAKHHGMLKATIGTSFWMSPKGMVWAIDCAEHSYFVYTILGEHSWDALEAAGWLHVSDGRIDHRCKINSSQQRPLARIRALGEGSFYENPCQGGENRPVPLETPSLFDVRPERVATEEKEAA